MLRVIEHGWYMRGAINALLVVKDLLVRYGKPCGRPYVMAEIDLALSDMRSAERFIARDGDIGYRNHKRKGSKLISVEAYYIKDKKR